MLPDLFAVIQPALRSQSCSLQVGDGSPKLRRVAQTDTVLPVLHRSSRAINISLQLPVLLATTGVRKVRPPELERPEAKR